MIIIYLMAIIFSLTCHFLCSGEWGNRKSVSKWINQTFVIFTCGKVVLQGKAMDVDHKVQESFTVYLWKIHCLVVGFHVKFHTKSRYVTWNSRVRQWIFLNCTTGNPVSHLSAQVNDFKVNCQNFTSCDITSGAPSVKYPLY